MIFQYRYTTHNDQIRVTGISITLNLITSLCWAHSKSSLLVILKRLTVGKHSHRTLEVDTHNKCCRDWGNGKYLHTVGGNVN
jgi:hypothetical protein